VWPRRLISIALIASSGSCGGGGEATAPTIPDCAPLGEHLAQMIVSNPARNAKVFAALCSHDTWSAQVRGCLAKARERDVEACAQTGMPPEHAERFRIRIRYLAAGGELAVKAMDVSDQAEIDGLPAKPVATCDTAGLRFSAGLSVLVERERPQALKGGVDGTVVMITQALCARDRWSPAALECARDARPEKGALDPCVALLAPEQRDAWISLVLTAIDEVERDITAGKAEHGAVWGGTIPPTPLRTPAEAPSAP